MDDHQNRLTRKASFYQELSALEESDEDGSDPGRQASENILKKARKRGTGALEPAYQSVNEPHSSLSGSRWRESQVHKEIAPPVMLVSNASRMQASELRQSATSSSGITSQPKPHGKRKHEPASLGRHKLFESLCFYFFPNNDIAPARRMRISKAIEFGAAWQRNWNSQVTHVILDKDMTYGDLLKFIKLQSLPEHIIAVQENYPADCISYRTLLNPKLPQFVVKGYTPPSAEKHVSPTVEKPLESKLASTEAGYNDLQTHGIVKVNRISGGTASEESSQAERSSNQIQSCTGVPGDECNEEFELALKQARALQDLPIDDEDESSTTSASEEADTNHIDERSSPPVFKKRKTTSLTAQEKFQCMQKHTGEKSDSPNLATIEILQQMADYYGKTGDEWRVRAYRKVIGTLRNHPTRVVTKEDALKLPNIGERLALKIEEIVLTNRLQRLEHTRAEPGDKVLQVFMQIYGVGLKQASKWVHEGYSSLAELSQKASLSDAQRVGIEHYEDFNSRIPRAEVEEHGKSVRQAVRRVDPSFEVIIGGSYRRGADTSGDIDCIVTRPGADAAHLRSVVLGQVVPSLFDAGFLVAALATSTRDDGSKWHGASRLPGTETWRRLDLLLVPWDEMGAALIYFTGNDIFNRSLRLLARKKGMRLNQRGLYRDVLRGKGGTKFSEGTLVEGKDERRIFEILGVPWRPPEHRVC